MTDKEIKKRFQNAPRIQASNTLWNKIETGLHEPNKPHVAEPANNIIKNPWKHRIAAAAILLIMALPLTLFLLQDGSDLMQGPQTLTSTSSNTLSNALSNEESRESLAFSSPSNNPPTTPETGSNSPSAADRDAQMYQDWYEIATMDAGLDETFHQLSEALTSVE